MNRDIRFKFGIDIEDGPLLRPRIIKRPLGARGLGQRDQISKFLDPPYNFGTNIDICFKFGTDIEDGTLLRPDHKRPQNGCGLGHVTKFRLFWDPLITVERTEISTANFAQT